MSDPYYDTPELSPSGIVFELDSENCFEDAGTLNDYSPLDESFHGIEAMNHSFDNIEDASIPTRTYSHYKQPYVHSGSTSTDMNLEQHTNASSPISPLSSYRGGTNSLRAPSELGSIQFSSPEQSISSPMHRWKSTPHGPTQAKVPCHFSDISHPNTNYIGDHIFTSSSVGSRHDSTREQHNHISPLIYSSAFTSRHQPYTTSNVHSASLPSVEPTHRGFESQVNVPPFHENYHARPPPSSVLMQFGSHLMDANPNSQLLSNHLAGYPSDVEAYPSRVQLRNSPQHSTAAQLSPSPPEAGTISCPSCPTTFTGKFAKGNRGRHIRTIHGGQKSTAGLVCRFCRQKFRRSDATRKHERDKHVLQARPGPFQ